MTHAFADPLLFGHDPTLDIVSVHADLSGRALAWCREGGQLTLERTRYRSWLYARTVDAG